MSPRSQPVVDSDWSPQATLFKYTADTYAISWSLWGAWAISDNGSMLTDTILFVFGGIGPFGASVILDRTADRSLRTWLRGVFEFRIAVGYYALAVAVPVTLVINAGKSLGVDRPVR